MSRAETERLRDIAQASTAIKNHIERAQNEPALLDDSLLHDALLYEFIVIGEAVKNLTPETRASAPETPPGIPGGR